MTTSIRMQPMAPGAAGVPAPAAGAPTASGSAHLVNIVRKERRGYARAFPFEIQENETMAAFTGRLKAQLGASSSRVWFKKMANFEEEAVFEAKMCSIIPLAHPDLERGAALVDLGPLAYSGLLTEAYHNSKELGDLAHIKDAFKKYKINRPPHENLAIVLGWKTCKTYMIVNLGIICALSALVGVVAGVICHDANLGIAVGGGLFALVGTMVALLAIMTK